LKLFLLFQMLLLVQSNLERLENQLNQLNQLARLVQLVQIQLALLVQVLLMQFLLGQ
jgi:hypothetical protein